MIIVFGGTTEGKKVAGFLDRKSIPYLYSTKMESTRFIMDFGEYRFGALDADAMTALFEKKGIRMVIDATHPFAAELHENIARACDRSGIGVIRFERDYSMPAHLSEQAVIHNAGSFDAAVSLLIKLNPQRVLAATGIQSLEPLRPYWERREMKLRVLFSGRSALTAQKKGFPAGHLIMMNPPRTVEEERHCLMAYGIDCLLTKESGASGFLPEKIAAASSLGIPIVLVRRPSLPAALQVVRSFRELGGLLQQASFQA